MTNLTHLNELRKIAGLHPLTEAPLSRVDVDANIAALLQQIQDLCQRVAEASAQNTMPQADRSQDKWGVQGNLVHVRSSLNDILQFIGGGQ